MTTQERLKDAAAQIRKSPGTRLVSFNGEYLHELLDRAADEIDQLMALMIDTAKR